MAEPSNPAPAIDLSLQGVLDAIHETLPATLRPDDLALLRSGSVTPSIEEVLSGRSVRHEERSIPGTPGSPDITISIFRPDHTTPAGPAFFFTHVSGMIFGDRFVGIAPIIDYVEQLNAVVVSVEYRLAPENPAPAAFNDSFVALQWTAAHSTELGFDPDKLFAVGISAGGGISAALALKARDVGAPRLAGSILMSAGLDDRNNTLSSQQMAETGLWDHTSSETGWTMLLGAGHGSEDVSPYDSPSRATDLSGLPPTYIDVGSVDTFRDEDVTYASAIWAAGGNVELHVWPGGYHLFELVAPKSPLSIAARDARLNWLRRIIAS